MVKSQSDYSIRVLDRALSVLEILNRHISPMRLTEIREELGRGTLIRSKGKAEWVLADRKLPYPSTVYRMMRTLKDRGFVQQDSETRRYRLGQRAIELGITDDYQPVGLRDEAALVLKELVKLHDETAHFGVLVGAEVLFLVKEESTKSIRMASQVGRRLPAYCTALGKVLLAYLSEEERRRILGVIPQSLYRYTSNTIRTKKGLERTLSEIKRKGFAEDKGELEEQVNCIAAPVKTCEGEVIAGISVSGPYYRMDGKRDEIRKSLIRITSDMSKRIVYDQAESFSYPISNSKM